MADEFQLGTGNWWDTSRNRFETGTETAPPSISTTLNAIASFGWPTEMKPRPSLSAGAASGGSAAATVLADSNLEMMGLGLSSQGMDWNQTMFRGEKSEGSFRSMLQEDMSSNTTSNFQQESSSMEHWRNKLYPGVASEDSSINNFKRGFSLDQTQFSTQENSPNDSSITSQSLTAGFQVDSAAAYGLFLSENPQQHPSSSVNYPYASGGYGANPGEPMASWNKFPQFLRSSPPKQAAVGGGGHLHFTNNTPFWNAAAPGSAVADGRSGFLQTQIPAAPSFDEKPKFSHKSTSSSSEMGPGSKKNSTEASSKRPRNEAPSSLPAFKVRKEKMGDRITALQQLVSPFGKTDTASVLSEAIAYIKFLHEQVSVLSNPYMKNGAPIQHQQNFDKSKDDDGPRQDLRSRGLCLVPVSSTFPVTHETTVDFWTPTFGGTFR